MRADRLVAVLLLMQSRGRVTAGLLAADWRYRPRPRAVTWKRCPQRGSPSIRNPDAAADGRSSAAHGPISPG